MLKIILNCFAASLFSFFNLVIFSMMNVLGVYLLNDLKLTATELGFIGSCDLWGNVCGFLPIGLLLDKYNTRKIAFGLLSLAIISTFLMAFAQNLTSLSLLRFLQGIASAGSLLITMRMGVVFVNHSNKLIGFMIFIALSGGLLGNSGFSYLAHLLGWQTSLKLIAMLGLFCLFIMWLWLQDTKNLASSTGFSVKKVINKHRLLAGLQIGILNSPVFLLGSLFGNHLLVQQTDFNIKQTTFLNSLLFLGIMLASPVFGYLADRISSRKIILLAYTGMILTFSLLALHINLSFFVYSVLFFLIGCFCSSQNLIYPLLYKRETESPSTATAVSALVFNSLGGLLQIIFGFVLGLVIQPINLSLLFFPLLFATGILLLFREEKQQRSSSPNLTYFLQ